MSAARPEDQTAPMQAHNTATRPTAQDLRLTIVPDDALPTLLRVELREGADLISEELHHVEGAQAGIPLLVGRLREAAERDGRDAVPTETLREWQAAILTARQEVEPPQAPRADGYYLADLGNARRLVKAHRHELRYVPLRGTWLIWDGTRWAWDESGETHLKAKGVVDGLFTEAASTRDDKLFAFAKRSGQSNRIAGMLKLAESEPGIPVAPAALDADPWALNVRNGTIDLRTGRLLPHDPARLITKMAPVEHDPDATCPTWDTFLNMIFGNDASLIAFLQRAVGYTLTSDIREQVLLILYGTGANGKTTFLETISAMMGDYAKAADFSTFAVSQGEKIPNDLARLVGARFVRTSELESGKRLAEETIKRLTGGEPILARFMRQEFFEFLPAFKLFIAANHKPVIRGRDKGIWRRIRLVPFLITVPDEQQDRDLPPKLQAELPGILAWAVRGCLDWQRQGLSVPTAVVSATKEYNEEQDVLADFLADFCVEKPTAFVSNETLYAAYHSWCDTSGDKPVGKRTLLQMLADRGFTRGHSGGHQKQRGLWGVGLREGATTPGADVADVADANSGLPLNARAGSDNRKSASATSATSANVSTKTEPWPGGDRP